MENKNDNKGFSFTYSAREQEEIRKIREKYTESSEQESKMERLRRLDASVGAKAQTVSLILGVAGTLILGCGMSLCMSELGASLHLDENISMTLGVIIGVFGGILAGFAYPAYELTVKRERKKIAPEILLLTDELMKF